MEQLKKLDKMLMTTAEKQAYGILGKSIRFKNVHYEVGMLWKNPNIYLNKVFAVQR